MKWWGWIVLGIAVGIIAATVMNTSLKAGATAAHDGSYDQVYTFNESAPDHIYIWIQDDEDYVSRCIEAWVNNSGDVEVEAHYQ